MSTANTRRPAGSVDETCECARNAGRDVSGSSPRAGLPDSREDSVIIEPVILNLVVALGIGLLIGAERERRKGEGPARSAAGIRTFTIASLVGAASFVVGAELLLAVATAGVA